MGASGIARFRATALSAGARDGASPKMLSSCDVNSLHIEDLHFNADSQEFLGDSASWLDFRPVGVVLVVCKDKHLEALDAHLGPNRPLVERMHLALHGRAERSRNFCSALR